MNMLALLRRIMQDVSQAESLMDALEVIVERVREAMDTEVCSIYLLDPATNRYVLMATRGLKPTAVGRVSLGHSEGLVGLVGVREEPVNLVNAREHPRYRYFPETGEEQYNAFLGVPIIHQRRNLGVLVVQQKDSRQFDEGEEAFLVTVSAQLAAVISHSEAVDPLQQVLRQIQAPRRDVKFHGVAGAPGVGMGICVVKYPPADLDAVPDRQTEDVEEEIALFRKAVEAVRADIHRVSANLSGELRPEEAALFAVYANMLDDKALKGEVIRRIQGGQWAQAALRDVVRDYVRHFEALEDDYLRERATDIRDLGQRVLSYLQRDTQVEYHYPSDTILVADELTPAMLGEVPRERLRALASVKGSLNSHVAILARAMGLPCVVGIVDLPISRLDGQRLIVDGFNGDVYANPSPELERYYADIVAEEAQQQEQLGALAELPAETLDGHRVQLFVNTGLMTDVARSLRQGAEGVGLYRTEIPFMINERFPSEQEQYSSYREQLEAFAPCEVVMRTLDIGGDKSLSYFPIEEQNPFLGWRGIRVTLDHPEIFLTQVRAMLKASAGLHNLRIMLPMISNVSEVEEAQRLIFRVHEELRGEGLDIRMPPIGVMIEVPAAVFQIRDLCERVDFLSVGSNDLTQYMLAVDRNNPRVASLYHHYHPAVLQALYKIVCDAHAARTPVGICGELAGDPAGALLLLGMGYDSLSMSAVSLLKIKSVIRTVSRRQAEEVVRDVLYRDSPQVVKSILEHHLRKLGFERYVRPLRKTPAQD